MYVPSIEVSTGFYAVIKSAALERNFSGSGQYTLLKYLLVTAKAQKQ